MQIAADPAAAAGTTERISVDSAGTQANQSSLWPSISADGRFVAFSSYASNLVAGDTNWYLEVFVHDRQTGTTERVSVDSAGAEANGGSFEAPSISADGRFVAFTSDASNLVAGDTNASADIFVRDRQAGTTERVSVDSGKAQANGMSYLPSLSADGRFVGFASSASNLVAGDTNGHLEVFVRDRQAGTTERVSVDSAGGQANGISFLPSLSVDGRFVGFTSSASNLVAGDTNGWNDVFVRDRQAGTTERVSVDSAGVEGNFHSSDSSISVDGRFVAFISHGSNLVAEDTNDWWHDVFVRDRQAGTTERVSVDSAGAEPNGESAWPSISADGRFVAFNSSATNLDVGDTNGSDDIFVHDRQTGTTQRVSVDSAGAEGNSGSVVPSLTPDARFVAFISDASNLVAGDTNGVSDIFVRELLTTVTEVPEESPRARAHRAFSRVLGPVHRDNHSFFAPYLAMAYAGASYDELVSKITRDYLTQAYDKIFRYRNDPAFSPTSKTAVPFNEEVYNRILTWVKAPGELKIDGEQVTQGAEPIWTYVAKSAPVWGAHSGGVGKTNGEKCFGAMGSGCKGTGVEEMGGRKGPQGVEKFRRMDGLEMHYIDIPVAVGSIAHDRACLEDRGFDYYVAYCHGFPDKLSEDMEARCHGGDERACPGVREWWKSGGNLFDGRHWRYRFGPYPFVGFENPRKSAVAGSLADSYQDDAFNTRVLPNRPAGLPTWIGDKSRAYEYSNGEAAITTVLFAPSLTPIDYTDAAFCAAGQASEIQTEFNTTPWRICSTGAGGGGGGGDDKPPKRNK